MPKRVRDEGSDGARPNKIRRLGKNESIEPQARIAAPSIPWCLIEVRAGIYRSLDYHDSLVKTHFANGNELKNLRSAKRAPPFTVERQMQKERLSELINWEYSARSYKPELDRRKIKALICPAGEYHYVTPAFLKHGLSVEDFARVMRQGQLPHKLAENAANEMPSTMIRDWRYKSVCFRADAALPAGLGSHYPFEYTDVFVKEADGVLRNFYDHLTDERSSNLDQGVLDKLGISKMKYLDLKLHLAHGVTDVSHLSSQSSEAPLEIVTPTPYDGPSTSVNRHVIRDRIDRGL